MADPDDFDYLAYACGTAEGDTWLTWVKQLIALGFTVTRHHGSFYSTAQIEKRMTTKGGVQIVIRADVARYVSFLVFAYNGNSIVGLFRVGPVAPDNAHLLAQRMIGALVECQGFGNASEIKAETAGAVRIAVGSDYVFGTVTVCGLFQRPGSRATE